MLLVQVKKDSRSQVYSSTDQLMLQYWYSFPPFRYKGSINFLNRMRRIEFIKNLIKSTRSKIVRCHHIFLSDVMVLEFFGLLITCIKPSEAGNKVLLVNSILVGQAKRSYSSYWLSGKSYKDVFNFVAHIYTQSLESCHIKTFKAACLWIIPKTLWWSRSLLAMGLCTQLLIYKSCVSF